MICTPEEANKKWCPYSGETNANCVADHCMKWEWEEQSEVTSTDSVEIPPEGDGWEIYAVDSKAHWWRREIHSKGYCGA